MPSEFESGWLKEALATLDGYNEDPVVDTFLDRYNLPPQDTKALKLNMIETEVTNEKKPPFFEDLSDYIDELKMYGKQHVFLYELKGDHKDYLSELRDPRYIREQLRQFDLEDSLNNGKPIWEAPEPKLAEVRHSFKEGEGLVLFKWVETRGYLYRWKDDRGIPHFTPKNERSVSFFIVNLENGAAEIRIQTMQPFSDRELRDELVFNPQIFFSSFIETVRSSPTICIVCFLCIYISRESFM